MDPKSSEPFSGQMPFSRGGSSKAEQPVTEDKAAMNTPPKSTPPMGNELVGIADRPVRKPVAPPSVRTTRRTTNEWIVQDSAVPDNSTIYLCNEDISQLQVLHGDTVFVRGRLKKETVLVVLQEIDTTPGFARMSSGVRSNLGVTFGQTVSIRPCPNIKYLKRVAILPIADTVQGFTGSLFDDFLGPYFREAYRPIHKGDTFTVASVKNVTRQVEFHVTEVDSPVPYGIIAQDTVIHCDGTPIQRSRITNPLRQIGYDNIGGYRQQIGKLRNIFDVQCQKPQFLRALNLPPVRGVLLHGPRGSGKTYIARAVANETGVYFFVLSGFGSVADIRRAFKEARKHAPAIVFFDNIDVTFPRAASGDAQRTYERELLWQMEALGEDNVDNVILMAACNNLDAVSAAMRGPGRFVTEIKIGVPDGGDRLDILQKLLQKTALAEDVELEVVAERTDGFVAGDLVGLCREAGMHAINDTFDTYSFDDDDEFVDGLRHLQLRMEDLLVALEAYHPSQAGRCPHGCETHPSVCRACGKPQLAGTVPGDTQDELREFPD